jgi:hypothetical protein
MTLSNPWFSKTATTTWSNLGTPDDPAGFEAPPERAVGEAAGDELDGASGEPSGDPALDDPLSGPAALPGAGRAEQPLMTRVAASRQPSQ